MRKMQYMYYTIIIYLLKLIFILIAMGYNIINIIKFSKLNLRFDLKINLYRLKEHSISTNVISANFKFVIFKRVKYLKTRSVIMPH